MHDREFQADYFLHATSWRRAIAAAIFLLLSQAFAVGLADDPPAPAQPNIVLLYADDK